VLKRSLFSSVLFLMLICFGSSFTFHAPFSGFFSIFVQQRKHWSVHKQTCKSASASSSSPSSSSASSAAAQLETLRRALQTAKEMEANVTSQGAIVESVGVDDAAELAALVAAAAAKKQSGGVVTAASLDAAFVRSATVAMWRIIRIVWRIIRIV
jgi:hypothetical protein